jgi:hypothetical protein
MINACRTLTEPCLPCPTTRSSVCTSAAVNRVVLRMPGNQTIDKASRPVDKPLHISTPAVDRDRCWRGVEVAICRVRRLVVLMGRHWCWAPDTLAAWRTGPGPTAVSKTKCAPAGWVRSVREPGLSLWSVQRQCAPWSAVAICSKVSWPAVVVIMPPCSVGSSMCWRCVWMLMWVTMRQRQATSSTSP